MRALGALLYWLGLAPIFIRLGRRRPRVLLYHACDPSDSAFTRGLGSNTHPDQFRKHLTFLQRHYNVVSLAALEAGRIPERAVAITFDDGYRSVFDHAAPELRHFGMTATVYLISGAVGNESLVWVNELAWFFNTHRAVTVARMRPRFGITARMSTAAVIDRVREQYDRDLIHTLLEELRRATGTDGAALARSACLYMTWPQVRDLGAAGITFGNHTMSHPNLAALDVAAQRAELSGAREAITQQLGHCTSVA